MAEFKTHSLKLHRDEDGNLIPLEGISPMLNMTVKVLPLTYGISKSFESFGKSIFDWSEEDRMRLINEHVVAVDDAEIEIESVQDMMDNYDAYVIEDLIHSVIIISGLGRFYDPEAGNVVGEGEE